MATTNINSTERGAVALITAMIVSILLMITTAGMVSLTVKSLRQSTDGAQSTKAYYAAESGLEDALLKLRRDPSYKGDCTGGTATDSPSSAASGAITCVKVTQNSGAATGRVELNETDQIDLSEITNVGMMTVEWSQNAKVPEIPNYSGGFPVPGPIAEGKWDPDAPAVLEFGIIEYPRDANFLITDVDFYEGVLAPMSSKSTDPSGNMSDDDLYSYRDSAPNKTNRAFVGKCTQTSEYQCQMLVGNFNRFGDKRYVLRVKSRYSGTNYRISVKDNNGNALDIPNTMYTIDVTARAGDVFRRAQTSFSTVPESISGLDYVLYSDTDICKAYEIKGTASGLNGCQVP